MPDHAIRLFLSCQCFAPRDRTQACGGLPASQPVVSWPAKVPGFSPGATMGTEVLPGRQVFGVKAPISPLLPGMPVV